MTSMQTTGDKVVYPWEFELSGEIQEFHIWHSRCIDAIMFVYKDNNNEITKSPRFGSKDGGSLDVVKFAPEEYILGVRGPLGFVDGIAVVGGFQFLTTRGLAEPVSTPGTDGIYDLSLASGDKRLRFYGNYGTKYLHSFGFAAAPVTNSDNGYIVRELVEAQVKKNPAYVIAKDGPFGGDGANSWEFTFPHKVREIHIWSDKYIHSIMFVYKDNDNKDVNSQRFGGNGGNLNKVTVRDDFLVGFGGSYGDFEGNIVIMSIRFEGNTKGGKQFGSINQGYKFDVVRTGPLKLIKFHGKYGTYLHSIGAVYDINGDGGKEVQVTDGIQVTE